MYNSITVTLATSYNFFDRNNSQLQQIDLTKFKEAINLDIQQTLSACVARLEAVVQQLVAQAI